MTIKELRDITIPMSAELGKLAAEAQEDDFAPWVVECLRRAARYASLSEDALDDFKPK